jgi:hypothetical protein
VRDKGAAKAALYKWLLGFWRKEGFGETKNQSGPERCHKEKRVRETLAHPEELFRPVPIRR